MPLAREEVEKIAHLSRLNLTAEELNAFSTALSNILNLVTQINEVNTDNIVPMTHPFCVTTSHFRQDEVSESNQRNLTQPLAPATAAGLYLVPKVIEID